MKTSFQLKKVQIIIYRHDKSIRKLTDFATIL